MPRKRERDASRVVCRTARCGLRVTRHQRERVFGLLRSAGDVWCCVLELAAWRRSRQDLPLAGTRGCAGNWPPPGRARSGNWTAPAPGRCCAATATPGSPPPNAARRVTRAPGTRGANAAWCRCAGIRAHSRSTGGVLAIPVARGCPPLTLRLDRDIPYPAGQVRSVTLGYDAGTAVRGRDRRGPRRALPARARAGPGPDRRDRPGHHPPLRRRRAGRAGAAGVRTGHPGRMPPAPARPQRPHPRRRRPRAQTRAAGLAPVAQAPQERAARRRPATPGGSAKPSTKPPKQSSAGRWSTGSAPLPSATPAASCTSKQDGSTTSGPGTGGSGT